jgi:hypothetical protein
VADNEPDLMAKKVFFAIVGAVVVFGALVVVFVL